jgi:hypothetical protein
MPFNGSGTYSLPAGNPFVTGTTISSTTTNSTNSDIATALTNCLTRDGQSTPSANLPMNANKLTGLAAGTSAGDSVRYEQVFGQVLWLAGGTMTGDIVFNSGQPLGTPSSGTLSSCTVDGTNAVGFKNIPQTGSDKTTAYTLATTDVGKYVGVGTSGSIVVPNSTFANGDAVSVFNNTSGNITLTMSIATAYIGGINTDKATITLATRGIATILFVSATVCVVTGNVS